jgi:hypothetical protein
MQIFIIAGCSSHLAIIEFAAAFFTVESLLLARFRGWGESREKRGILSPIGQPLAVATQGLDAGMS